MFIAQITLDQPALKMILFLMFAGLACYAGGSLGPCVSEAQPLLRGPANSKPVVWEQPDGTQITIRLFGDEHYNFAETMDGYTVVRAAGVDGWMYARKGADGWLHPTEILAHEAELRTVAEHRFLNGISPHLRPDLSIIEPLQHKHDHDAQASVLQRLLSEARQGGRIELNVPVLLIGFVDLQGTIPKTTMEAMMNEPGWSGGINSPGSFNDYLLEASYGQVSINADVFGWYDDPVTHRFYGDYFGAERLRALIWRAIEAADKDGADFSKYDNDGDGRCDGIVVIHAGLGAAQYGDRNFIWPRALRLRGSREYDGVRFDLIGISSELVYKNRSQGIKQQAGIGMHMHEFFHVYGGLPDLYDRDQSSKGIGVWDIMSGGVWLDFGLVFPSHLSAWSKKKIGWIRPNRIRASGRYSFEAVEQDSSAFYQVTLSADYPSEHFLLEYRKQTGWDVKLPGSGLLVWHIDESRPNNDDETHKLVDLEAADGRDDLDHKRNSGDAGDVFPGSSMKREFTHTSYPNTRSYRNPLGPSSIRILEITSTGSSGSAIIVNTENVDVDFLSDRQTGHVPLRVAFANQSSGDNFTAWSWDFEGEGVVGSMEHSPVRTYEMPGDYTVTLSAQLDIEGGVDFWMSSTRNKYIRAFDGNSGLFMGSRGAYGELSAHENFEMTETMTLEAWVRPEDLNFSGSETSTIIDKGSFALHVQKSGVGQFPGNSLVVSIQDALRQESWWSTPPRSMELDAWQHIAVVLDLANIATPVRILIDGKPQSISVTGNLSSVLRDHALKSARIGNRGDGTATFEGTLDELRIWNTARTNEEIKDLMTSRLTGDIGVLDGLIGYWPMNEGSGGGFKDESVYANHGTTTGSWGSGAPVTNMPVNISEGDVVSLGEASVYPNYPNPFGVSTLIPIHVPEPTTITLEIYNVLGQLVHTVVEEQFLSQGRHEIKVQSHQLANGVYTYSIRLKTARGTSQTIPGVMTVLR